MLGRIFIACIVVSLSVGCVAKEKLDLKNEKHKQSYAIGQNIGLGFKQQKLEINVDILAQSIQDAIKDDSKMTDEEIRETLTKLQEETMKKLKEEANVLSKKNTAEGEAYLAKNKTKKGVKVTKSGLQYKVLKKGTGKVHPKATDQVEVHYKGMLLNGTVFDSSYKRNKSTSFALNRVIPGWTEGVQLMKVGDEFEFYIPSDLAYGERGTGGDIGPNATLIFQVKLLSINKK